MKTYVFRFFSADVTQILICFILYLYLHTDKEMYSLNAL